MEPWAIVTITILTGLGVFILIFWLKQKKAKKREVQVNDSTQFVVQAQIPQQQQQQQPMYPSAPTSQSSAIHQQSNAYPAPYASQQQQLYPVNQQIGFINQPQAVTFVPQQSPFIPSTNNQGIINARNPQDYININTDYNPRMMAVTTNTVRTF